MNFILKIVEGPNKGAEIALVSGVAVTLGKGDDCDIVLADTTLPSAPVTIEASDDGVAVDGEPLDQFVVMTTGATSFAVGPADAPWGALKWPEKAEARDEKAEGSEPKEEKREGGGESGAPSPAPKEGADRTEGEKRRRGGCFGCLAALVLLILAVAAVAWFYRAAIEEFCKEKGYDVSKLPVPHGKAERPLPVEKVTLATVAARYGLSIEEANGTARIVGNLKTRAERLRATAEAYDAKPGVELDLSDDESFRTAAEDALFTLTEGALRVVSATNRVLSIAGVSRSPQALGRTLKALNADLPKLRDVDASGVRLGAVRKSMTGDGVFDEITDETPVVTRPVPKKPDAPVLPVCGILTKPYPCLVMRNGARVLEGASIGENVIVRIGADEVTVTNSTGRFTWKP